MADDLNLSDAERDLVLAHRTAAEAKKQKQQSAEKPPDIDDIVPGMPAATRQRIIDRIMSVANK